MDLVEGNRRRPRKPVAYFRKLTAVSTTTLHSGTSCSLIELDGDRDHQEKVVFVVAVRSLEETKKVTYFWLP
jgi:hypothetical protein